MNPSSDAVAKAPPAKAIVYDGIYTLSGRILRTGIALAVSILVARALGPRERGLYALPTVLYTGMVLAVFNGITTAVSYFMLNARAGRGVLRPALLTGCIFTVIGAVPVTLMAIFGHNAWALIPALLLLPVNVPPVILYGYAIGTKRIRWSTSYGVITTAAVLCAMAAAFLRLPHTAVVAVNAFVAVNAIVAAATLAFVFADARTLERNPVKLRDFLTFSLRVGAVNLVTLLNYRADLYVVALLLAPAAVGQYAVAISAAESILIVTQVASIVTSPHVGAMERTQASLMTAQCVRVTWIVALLICAVTFVLAPLLVHVLYGQAYLPLVPALRILLIAVMILSLGSPVSNFFTLKLGTPEVSLFSSGSAAVVCVVLSLLLVPRLGIVGAAIATAFAYLLGQGVAIGFFLRLTKFSLSSLLMPTAIDFRAYWEMVAALVRDVRRKLAA